MKTGQKKRVIWCMITRSGHNMSYTVYAAIKMLEEIAEEHPEAELKIDPPYSDVRSITYRSSENVVEMSH